MNGYTYSAQLESRVRAWSGEIRDPAGRLIVRTSATFSDPRAAIDHVTRQHEAALRAARKKVFQEGMQ